MRALEEGEKLNSETQSVLKVTEIRNPDLDEMTNLRTCSADFATDGASETDVKRGPYGGTIDCSSRLKR